MTINEELSQMAARLREMFPETNSASLSSNTYSNPCLNLHGFESYETAQQTLRNIGIGSRNKTVYPEGRCTLEGKVCEITVTAYISELPPSCHKETYIEKVPKQKTIDTGEFIEIERTMVVCGKD